MAETEQDYESALGINLMEFQAKWSKEDLALRDWLTKASDDEIIGCLEVIKHRLNNNVCTNNFFDLIAPRYPDTLSERDKQFSAMILVHELRDYSGRTIGDSVPYERTLTRVHKRIGKHFKKLVPEIATVAAREEAITMIMLGEAIENMSVEELQSALSGVELDHALTAEKLKPLMVQTLVAGGAAGLVRLLGKNVIKRVVLAIIEKYLQRKLGQKATEELIKKLGQKLAAQALKRVVFWVGIALLLKDIWDLSGEATRITTPLVSAIAIPRTLGRLAGN